MILLPVEEAFRSMVTKDLRELGPKMGVPDAEVTTLLEKNLDSMTLDFMRPLLQVAHATGHTEILMDKELRFTDEDFKACKEMLKTAIHHYKFERKAPLN